MHMEKQEMEIGNRNWKQKLEMKTGNGNGNRLMSSVHHHYSNILLSSSYMTGS